MPSVLFGAGSAGKRPAMEQPEEGYAHTFRITSPEWAGVRVLLP